MLGHVNLPASVRDPILQGLEGVVADPSGTAYPPFHSYIHFSLSSFPIAGKTGTASNAPGVEPNSWFVGFGPTNHPQYVVLCVIAEGGYGADASAPVVAKTFNYLVDHPVPAAQLSPALTHAHQAHEARPRPRPHPAGDVRGLQHRANGPSSAPGAASLKGLGVIGTQGVGRERNVALTQVVAPLRTVLRT